MGWDGWDNNSNVIQLGQIVHTCSMVRSTGEQCTWVWSSEINASRQHGIKMHTGSLKGRSWWTHATYKIQQQPWSDTYYTHVYLLYTRKKNKQQQKTSLPPTLKEIKIPKVPSQKQLNIWACWPAALSACGNKPPPTPSTWGVLLSVKSSWVNHGN